MKDSSRTVPSRPLRHRQIDSLSLWPSGHCGLTRATLALFAREVPGSTPGSVVPGIAAFC